VANILASFHLPWSMGGGGMWGKAVFFSTLRCTVDKGKAKFQISKDWQKTRGWGLQTRVESENFGK